MPKRLIIPAVIPALITLAIIVLVAPVRGAGAPGVNDEGWTIDRFASVLDFDTNGAFVAREEIDVDFGAQSKHGILRDIVARQTYDWTRNRQYLISLLAVSDAAGRQLKVDETSSGKSQQFRIGDPDVTVSGKKAYRVAYQVLGGLTGFADHDELNWNVTGTWPARMKSAAIVVRPPDAGSGITNAICFEGHQGSKETCRVAFNDKAATFIAARPLAPDEQITIVVSFRKGLFPAPNPVLVNRQLLDYFDNTPAKLAGATVVAALMIGGLAALWRRKRAR